MLLAWGTNSGSVDKDPKPPLEQGGVSGRVFTWVLVRKHRGEWKKRGLEKLRRFLKDFMGHDKDFGPWEAIET